MNMRSRCCRPRSTQVGGASALLALLVLVLPSCESSRAKQDVAGPLGSQLEELLRRVQYSQGLARLGDVRELSAFGKLATGPVKERLLSSDNPQLRSNAVFVLGEIYRLDRDGEALDAVRAAISDNNRSVRLEAARALLENGDWAGVDELVDALDDPGQGVRTRAFLSLRDASGGLDYGYHPGAGTVARQEPIARFRAHFSYARSGN